MLEITSLWQHCDASHHLAGRDRGRQLGIVVTVAVGTCIRTAESRATADHVPFRPEIPTPPGCR